MAGDKKNQKGFTLIELLVVIAVIGLLSSIILAGLSSARASAENTKQWVGVQQLITALDLFFHENNGVYPDVTDERNGNCFGMLDSESCYLGIVSGNTALKNELAPYYQGQEEARLIELAGSNLSGVRYMPCSQMSNSLDRYCTRTPERVPYAIVWIEENASECVAADNSQVLKGDEPGNHVECIFRITE